MSSVGLSTSNSFLQLLNEDNVQLKVIGLQKLINIVDYLWPEIANKLTDIERLFEDEKFPQRQLAAYLASKVYFHLEEYEDSLNYALESGDQFDINQRNNQYVNCLLQKCIDKYASIKKKNYELGDKVEELESINPKIEQLVERIIDNAIVQNELKQAIGISLDTRRIDKLQIILEKAQQRHQEIFQYLHEVAQNCVVSQKFRIEVINLLIKAYESQNLDPTEYDTLCQCYFFLNRHEPIANILYKLLLSNEQSNILLAYQIAQDISENENRNFITKLIQTLPVVPQGEGQSVEQKQLEEVHKPRLLEILNGKLKKELDLLYLRLNNQADPQIILNIKSQVDVKNSIAHNSVIVTNAFLQAGTTNDTFLREHFEWIAKETHWARFSLIASLGVIHKNNVQNSHKLLQPYFPQQGPTPNYFAHGGAFYALGLIHSSTNDQEQINFLKSQIQNPQNNANEQIIHGACLGLGLIGLGSEDESLFEVLKDILHSNTANIGEAAGYGIGLIMAGTSNENVISEILNYAKETQHEKIIRSIAIALAMIMFGKEENADVLIEELVNEKDPILRYGAMFMIGMAYIGTSNNKAIKKLLFYASSDNDDDVRRAAVISLSFILINNHEQAPKIISLMVMSYNPHVRYGAALCLGIACAGKGHAETIQILTPMLKDTVDFVRQAAFLALAMVLQQTTEGMDPKVETFKKSIDEVLAKKHEDVLCKMGVILAKGILECGGRNCLIQLTSKTKSLKMGACLGMLTFSQFWYWFPLVHFISLSFSPSALIGVDQTLKIPNSFQVKCNTKPSLFAYPPHIKVEQDKKQEKVETVTLSKTEKVKARAAKKDKDKDGKDIPSKMDIELKQQSSQKPEEKKMDIEDKPAEAAVEEEKKKEEEPKSYMLNNPCRVLDKQENFIQFIDNKYEVIVKNKKKGILFLKNLKPEDNEEYYSIPNLQNAQQSQQNKPDQNNQANNNEVKPPEDFIFDEDAQLLK